MFRTWTGAAEDGESLARLLEAHLNEYAEVVISVGYTVSDQHYALAVYTPVDTAATEGEEAAVAVAEQIIDGAL
jgi:hypothetical protein